MSRRFLSLALFAVCSLFHTLSLEATQIKDPTIITKNNKAPVVEMNSITPTRKWSFDSQACECQLKLPKGLVFDTAYRAEKTSTSLKFTCTFTSTGSVRYISADGDGDFESGTLSLELSNNLLKRCIEVKIDESTRFIKKNAEGNLIPTTVLRTLTGKLSNQQPLDLTRFPKGFLYIGEDSSTTNIEFFYK